MATKTTFEINGQANLAPVEWQDLKVNVSFENDSVQGDINFGSFTFVDKDNEVIKNWFTGNIGATEGVPFKVSVADTVNNNQTIYVPFTGYLDWTTYKIKSSSQSQLDLIKTDSLNGLFERSQGITMQLLESKGIMPTSDGVNIPYIVANRNTKLENLFLVYQGYITLKTIIDETFKLVALLAQLQTAGALTAALNIVTTIANLVILVNQLIEQLKAIQDAFFPPIRNHRGIKLKTFLERGCQYMGYNIDFGTFGDVLDSVVLCPHKTDEIGESIGLFGGQTGNTNSSSSGILRPNDFGYILSDAFELCNKLFYTKIAVNGNNVMVKPFNDPSWILSATYIMPNVLVEDTKFYTNGTQGFNINEMVGRTLISFQEDDSDKWSISNINNSFSETIVSPITISNNKNVLLKGLDEIQIPYTLAIRTGEATKLFTEFVDLVNFVDFQVQKLRNKFDDIAGNLGQSLPPTNSFAITTENRDSSMKTENHFFSNPKIVWLESGVMPSNYVSKIGAVALYNNYHSYKSFVQGIKNPNDVNQTNQKRVYEDVTIPFGADSFSQIINNSFFTDSNGRIGKFTNIDWEVDKDKAIVSYYVFENYTSNLQQETL